MIDKLAITNFKAFASAEIPLGQYTLLSGLNSSGKSTVLQALALLRQAKERGLLYDYRDIYEIDTAGSLSLNGELVQLGTGQDVLHEDYGASSGGEVEIGFTLSRRSLRTHEYRARYEREADHLKLSYCYPQEEERDPEAAEDCPLFLPRFQYLKAERINPLATYPRSYEKAVQHRFLGTGGEYTIDFLHHYQDEAVRPGALLRSDVSPRLLDQVEAWMSEICPGVRIKMILIEQTDLVRLGFEFTRPGQLTTTPRRPGNVGFGLTYVLPVVVACLTAGPDTMILLENPEAHVHPQGQSAIARLTCAAAAAGAQMVVETHSDHILNGLRMSVKNGILPADDVRLHYFQRNTDGDIDIITPSIGSDGMLSHWPEGFFDEWDRSLDQLLD